MKPVKTSIKNLKAYQPNTLPFDIKLDANESKNYLFSDGINLGDIQVNYYPDSNSNKLRKAISGFVEIEDDFIISGNGSSEMIELLLKTYIDKNDKILSFEPSFSMYSIYSQIYAANYISVESEPDFSLDITKMIEKAKKVNPKIIMICSPNNPTGYLLSNEDILRLVKATKAIVVVDEAYIEFTTKQSSLINQIKKFDNLVILRTLSKAFGLAGIRLGFLVSNLNIISDLNKVKSPYNLNALTQSVGILALSQIDMMKAYTSAVIIRREKLKNDLKNLDIRTFPSEANFIFFYSTIENLFDRLAAKKILIRKFSGALDKYYRVSVGDDNENQQFIETLKEIINEKTK